MVNARYTMKTHDNTIQGVTKWKQGEGPGTPPFSIVLQIQNPAERFFKFPSSPVADWFKPKRTGLRHQGT
ncbi:MAG: hypothetical protein A2Z27_01635 [candidate division Zixibacteria bacterium RBG_16_50_21]|nr:MAG: hypothetical protein A2Z27_01635 [candidate division Zixibacteria bacterium RBG_16_50_21]